MKIRILFASAVFCLVAPAAEPLLKLDLGQQVSLELILVQPGSFQQGSPLEEAGRTADEGPRPVTLTKPFYLGKMEVTRQQFELFARETGYKTEAEDGTSGGFGWDGQKLVQRREFSWRNLGFPQSPQDPVGCVTWFDAQKFCQWLSKRTGRNFALPSEAQWEFAARAGTPTPWAVQPAEDHAWLKTNAQGRTHPVGQKKPNTWGFFDMSGNQWEWCNDWFGPYPAGAATNPVQTDMTLSDKPRRVLRGGSWLKDANGSRSASRYRNDPKSRNADNGFRVMTETILTAAPAANVEEIRPKPSTLPLPDAVKNQATEAQPIKVKPAADNGRTVTRLPLTPSETSHSSSQSTKGINLAWLLLIPGVGIIWMVFKKLLGRPGTPPVSQVSRAVPPIPTTRNSSNVGEVTNDGFWLKANAQPGSRIRWSCLADGTPLDGELEYQPSSRGQFVYTGATPEDIQVFIVGFAAGLASSQTRTHQERIFVEPPHRREIIEDRPAFPDRTTPSAY